MNITQKYKNFIDSNLIRSVSELVELLRGYPYYFKTETDLIIDVIQIKKTIKTDIYNSLEPYNEYKKFLSNMLINKYSFLDFYYFGNEKKEITKTELFTLLNKDIKLKKFTFYNYNDNIKFYVFYINNKWSITTKNQLDIYSINKKILFEKYTLYELFFKALTVYKLNVNHLNKDFNYVFILNTSDTNLVINEQNVVDLQIETIIDKKTNIDIEINKKNLKKLNLVNINTPKKIIFNDIFHFKKDIELSNNQRLIIQNNENNEKYIYNYPKFNMRYIYLNDFNKDPVDNIKKLFFHDKLDILLGFFPLYAIFVSNFIKTIDVKVEYLMRRYIEIYIKKDTFGEYLPYDKELLSKIHLIYRRTRRRIQKEDIRFLLLNLDTKKIKKIFLINYQLCE
tara:strand:- start:3988 stop:5172 length:1185 start_codon:yes stop_codon:yes gene_type:complete